MRGKDVDLPAVGQLVHRAAEGTVELARLLALEKALSVGRVRHDAAVQPAPVEARRVVDFKFHNVIDLGKLCVVLREGNGVGVDVSAPDLILAVEFLIHRLVGCVEPEHFVERRPVLRGKAAVEPRCAVARDERGFNGDGAAAAEGVTERVATIVVRELDHCGGERFLEGGRHALGAVAALVESLTRGVEPDGDFVLHDGKAHLIAPPRFGKLRDDAVGSAQALHDRLFHDRLAGGHGVERRVDGVAHHGELPLAGDPVLPVHRAHALKERFEIRRAELVQNQNDARAAAQVEVEARDVARFAAAENAAVLDAHVRKPQLFDLIAH